MLNLACPLPRSWTKGGAASNLPCRRCYKNRIAQAQAHKPPSEHNEVDEAKEVEPEGTRDALSRGPASSGQGGGATPQAAPEEENPPSGAPRPIYAAALKAAESAAWPPASRPLQVWASIRHPSASGLPQATDTCLQNHAVSRTTTTSPSCRQEPSGGLPARPCICIGTTAYKQRHKSRCGGCLICKTHSKHLAGLA